MLLNIALTGEIADSIHDIVDGEEFRGVKKARGYWPSVRFGFFLIKNPVQKCAIFYSISSLEDGLRGIDLGHRLIVSSLEKMNEEGLSIEQFSSLSPGKTMVKNAC